MTRLDIANFETLVKQLQIRKISTVALGELYETNGTKFGPYTRFYVVVTARDPEEGLVLKYRESFGGDCSYFEDRMKEISAKARKRGKEILQGLEKKGFTVIDGAEFKEGDDEATRN